MTIKKLRKKIKNKRWVEKQLNRLYNVSESLHNFEIFECSDFFSGKTLAERNRKIYQRNYKTNIRHINFLEKCKLLYNTGKKRNNEQTN